MFGIKLKVIKFRFQLTYFYDLLTYLDTIRAKIVMFGIKLMVIKSRFLLAYFYDLLTYIDTIRAKIVMFGIKLEVIKLRFQLTYLDTIRAKIVMFGIIQYLQYCQLTPSLPRRPKFALWLLYSYLSLLQTSDLF